MKINKTIFSLLLFTTMVSCISMGGYLESRYVNISDRVLPSVVEIISIGIEGEKTMWQDFFQNHEDFKSEDLSTGVGSGVIVETWEEGYYILTNKHVVADLQEVEVFLSNNDIVKGKVIGFDSRFDIAVVKIKSDLNLPVAKLALGKRVKVGQFVAALGSPLSYTQSISMGIISNFGRFGGPKDNLSNYIQTDAAINHGNSGGPLVNMKGEVIGINTWISSPTSGNIGIGFAMPIDNIYPSYRSIVDSGKVNIGWLGLSSYGIPDAESYKDLRGAFVNQIVIDSPAHKAGIKAGDLITSVNKKEIQSASELFLYISLLEPEDLVEIVLLRDGVFLEKSIHLGLSLDNTLETSKKVFPGFIPAERDDSIVILKVLPKSIGLSSGFKNNDSIISVNGSEINSIKELYKLLSSGNNKIIVKREDNEIELDLPN